MQIKISVNHELTIDGLTLVFIRRDPAINKMIARIPDPDACRDVTV